MYGSMGHTDVPQEVKQQIAAITFKDNTILIIVECSPLRLQHPFAIQQIQAINCMIRLVCDLV